MSFVEKLAVLDEHGRVRVADAWSRTEHEDYPEIELARWREMLDALASFAQATVDERRRMYMWISL